MQNRKRDTDVQNRLLDSMGEGEGGMFGENSIETCILSRVKHITSPGYAGVQPRQDPGGTLRMNSIGKREKIRETSLDRAKSVRGREREREREIDQTRGAAESGRVWQCFIFYHSFYTLS